jgi:NCAIR mutase (PurE)-related protein
MDRTEVRELLERVAAGGLEVDDALDELAAGPLTEAGYADLGFARLDTHRGLRTGDPEVVYAAGKTPDQVVTLLRTLHEAPGRRPALATRLAEPAMAAVRAAFPYAQIDEVAWMRCTRHPARAGWNSLRGPAGTSDLPVAAEAAFVAGAFGSGVERVDDGRGRHPPAARGPVRADSADCLIVVAGMEARCRAWSAGWGRLPSRCLPAWATAPRTRVSPRCWRC